MDKKGRMRSAVLVFEETILDFNTLLESKPEEIVQDVISFLYPLGYKSVRNLSENNETMTFKLPKELLD